MTHRSFVRRLAGTSIAAFILTASAVPTMAQDKKFKQVWVKTPDGLTISAQVIFSQRGACTRPAGRAPRTATPPPRRFGLAQPSPLWSGAGQVV